MEFNLGERVVVNAEKLDDWQNLHLRNYEYLGTIIGYSAYGTASPYLVDLEGIPEYNSGKNGPALTEGHYGEHAVWCPISIMYRPVPTTPSCNKEITLKFNVGDKVVYVDREGNHNAGSIYIGTVCGIIDEPEHTDACYLVDLDDFDKAYTGKDFALSKGTYGTHAVWARNDELKKIK